MESLYSIDNFEDGDACHEINSPRTLEACLRTGLDPSELMPKSRKSLTRKYMSEEMIDLAVSQAQWKRGELLKVVKEERARLMSFAKKKAETAQPGPSAIAATEMSDEQKSNHMIAMEEKRMLALKKRQEKEIEKMIEKETQTVELQLRLQKTEHEARQKKLEFDKKVAADKVVAAKKATQRLQERAQKEAEEVVKKKEMLKAERERAAIRKQKLEEELRRIEAEARVREIERAAKVEAKKKKTDGPEQKLVSPVSGQYNVAVADPY